MPAMLTKEVSTPFSFTVQSASSPPPEVKRASAYSPGTGFASCVVGNVASIVPVDGAASSTPEPMQPAV
ncbi:MAG: hypothetical protein BWX70_03522 [Verrucomicrobia bacterium ADurb.Bin070]|nr:MAG: hypothetical protein BWX70_03522 [Verrucomicrobia bacterium ADurb.Bin070]